MTSLALACKLNAARTPTSLAARAVAAIRRNNGTLLLPGAATPVLGGELVTNGAFYTDTGWVKGEGWSIAGGKAVRTPSSFGSVLSQSISLTPGKKYLVTYSLDVVAVGIYASLSGGSDVLGASRTASGTYSQELTAVSGNNLLMFVTSSNLSNLSIDNISVKEILSYTHGNPPLRNYLDSAGTDILDSVTQVDQPVGLVLDSMGVLGANLFTGTYLTGASTTATYSGNEATATFGGSLLANANNWLSIPGNTAIGTFTVIEYWATYVSGGSLEVGSTWQVGDTITAAANGGVRRRYTTSVRTGYAGTGWGPASFAATSAGSVWKVELISVREIPGNHASQPTTANKGILRRTSGRYRWEFDATDSLVVTLPAGFNAATTIDARSTGHVTLQNQNIVGAYSIGPSITSFGRIILPSSPSASDLALLQRYANWLAGL